MHHPILAYGIVCSLIAVKWSLELGHKGSKHFLYAVLGFCAGPLTLLFLYTRFLHKRVAQSRSDI